MGMKDKIFDVVVPTQEEIEVRDGKRRVVERHIFPGYVLVKMELSDDAWHLVKDTPKVTGFLGSKIVNRRGEGVVKDILLGVGGALMAGCLFQLIGARGVTGLNFWSLFVATSGAVFLVVAYHTIRRLGWSTR